MNTLKLTALLFFTSLSLSASAQFEKAEVYVSGMTCSMCQLGTQKALKTIDFISDIKPDLTKNSFVLTFRKDRSVNFDLIRKKIKDAGFSVSKLYTTFNFNKTAVSNSQFSYEGSSYRFINSQAQALNGDVKLMLISNGFIPISEFKKYAAQNSDLSHKAGLTGAEKVLYVMLASN